MTFGRAPNALNVHCRNFAAIKRDAATQGKTAA